MIITPGYNFSEFEQVTKTKLDLLVRNAQITGLTADDVSDLATDTDPDEVSLRTLGTGDNQGAPINHEHGPGGGYIEVPTEGIADRAITEVKLATAAATPGKGGTGISAFARGLLLAGTASGSLISVSLGADDQILKFDTGATGGVAWHNAPIPPTYPYARWYLTSAFTVTNVSSTFQTVPDITFPVTNGQRYIVVADLWFSQAGGTSGNLDMQYGFTVGDASVTDGGFWMPGSTVVSNGGIGLSAIPVSAGTTGLIHIEGHFKKINSDSILVLRIKQSTATSSGITLLPGTNLTAYTYT